MDVGVWARSSMGRKRKATHEAFDADTPFAGYPGCWNAGEASATTRPSKRPAFGGVEGSPAAGLQGCECGAAPIEQSAFQACSGIGLGTHAFSSSSYTSSPERTSAPVPYPSRANTETIQTVDYGNQPSSVVGELQRQRSLPDLRTLAGGLTVPESQQETQRMAYGPHVPYFSNEGRYLF